MRKKSINSPVRGRRLKRGVKRRCDFCKKLKSGVKREHLYNDEDDAVMGVNGCYRYLCRLCERDEVNHG